jgi:hypothetical protein
MYEQERYKSARYKRDENLPGKEEMKTAKPA